MFKIFLFAQQMDALKNDTPVGPVFPMENYGASLMKMFFMIIALIGFLILTLWMFKKFLKSRMQMSSQGKSIQILEKRSISPKSILYLVEVEGKRFLIGESQVQLQKIDALQEELHSSSE